MTLPHTVLVVLGETVDNDNDNYDDNNDDDDDDDDDDDEWPVDDDGDGEGEDEDPQQGAQRADQLTHRRVGGALTVTHLKKHSRCQMIRRWIELIIIIITVVSTISPHQKLSGKLQRAADSFSAK